MLIFVWVSLIVLAVWYCFVFVKDFLAHRSELENSSWLKTSVIGFVVNFFDVLGIGAFAPQTALLKFTQQTEDRLIPGTMNVANTIPVLLQAFIFITIIEVDPLTLILMLVSVFATRWCSLLGIGNIPRWLKSCLLWEDMLVFAWARIILLWSCHCFLNINKRG